MGKMESEFRKLYHYSKEAHFYLKNTFWNSPDRAIRICSRMFLCSLIILTIMLPPLIFVWLLEWFIILLKEERYEKEMERRKTKWEKS